MEGLNWNAEGGNVKQCQSFSISRGKHHRRSSGFEIGTELVDLAVDSLYSARAQDGPQEMERN